MNIRWAWHFAAWRRMRWYERAGWIWGIVNIGRGRDALLPKKARAQDQQNSRLRRTLHEGEGLVG